MNPAIDLWVYLSTSPLAWLALTLAAYVVADRIARRLNRHPLANPVVIAVVLVIIALQVSETPFETYFEGAQFVHFLLGPATVALAIPLVENWRRVKRSA
ncbi:LrgB family protein, partial [Bauldia litoralis]